MCCVCVWKDTWSDLLFPDIEQKGVRSNVQPTHEEAPKHAAYPQQPAASQRKGIPTIAMSAKKCAPVRQREQERVNSAYHT